MLNLEAGALTVCVHVVEVKRTCGTRGEVRAEEAMLRVTTQEAGICAHQARRREIRREGLFMEGSIVRLPG